MPIPAVASTATTKAFQTTSPISTHSGTTYLTVSPHIIFTWVFVFNKNLTSQFKDKDSDLVKDVFFQKRKTDFPSGINGEDEIEFEHSKVHCEDFCNVQYFKSNI